MNFTQEQLNKVKAVKSAEELLALAKENGIEMTEEEAAKQYAEWHKEGPLSEEELADVSGGLTFVLTDMPKFLRPFFRFFFKTKERDE